MSSFKGYFLKFGDVVFPSEYLAFDDNSTTPDQRTEAEAYVDANNVLHRVTLPKYRSKLEYNLVDDLHLADKIAIRNIVFNSSSIVNEIERKVRVTYWNDAINSYVENKMFYIPDTVYPIKKIVKLSDDEYDIVYRSIKLTLIEY